MCTTAGTCSSKTPANATSGIGDRIGVSSTTVGNCITNLGDEAIITGYQPVLDYEKAELDHRLSLTVLKRELHRPADNVGKEVVEE